jgi:flagellar motor switch protein FliM
MVNTLATEDPGLTEDAPDRRGRARAPGIGAGASLLGQSKLHPFGDLHPLQHLGSRLSRALRVVLENYLRGEVRCWSEPLVVERLSDRRAERGNRLTAWLPLAMDGRPAIAVLDGEFILKMLDLFFGGTGHAPEGATEFSPAAEALVARLGGDVAEALEAAWEPLGRVSVAIGNVETNPALIAGIEPDETLIATRFGITHGDSQPVFLDVLYPVATLKPHGQALTAKVVAKPVEVDASWQTELARAAMTVRLPVRSVLAEPRVSLAKLMDLKVGDVIPIGFNNDVPIHIGRTRIGTGTVGTANGHAAIRVTKLEGPAL